MKRTTKHGALDVHEATTVASVRESGRVIARSVLPTDGPNGLRCRLRAHTALDDRWPCRHRHGCKVLRRRGAVNAQTKPPPAGARDEQQAAPAREPGSPCLLRIWKAQDPEGLTEGAGPLANGPIERRHEQDEIQLDRGPGPVCPVPDPEARVALPSGQRVAPSAVASTAAVILPPDTIRFLAWG